jgi:hypothetical protein
MEKAGLFEQMTQRLTHLGVAYQIDQGTDVAISQEFLNAGWGMGKKKISYEASVFGDESSRTVFMWEMTKEIGAGFSFGFSSESSYQVGKTVFRKVKGAQYGPDGKVYEYDLDLGAIPAAVKETALNNGWKFKTVLRKKHALWPGGYSVSPSFFQAEEMLPPQDDQPPSGGEAYFCSQCGHTMGKEALFCTRCGSRKGD